MASAPIKTVCVTGGSGFIALHIVKQLLESGRRVHATVRSIGNAQKIAALTELSAQFPGMLNLFEADLLGPSEKFDAALEGCDACLHTASPFFMAGVTAENAEEKLVGPALKGTLSVLEACARVSSVKRVVVTSSFAAVLDPTDINQTYTEENWNTKSKAEDGGSGSYRYSKTVAERAAWEFVETKKPGFTLVTLNPPLVAGENVAKVSSFEDLNTSSQIVLSYLNGTHKVVPDGGTGLVDVEDLARAHLLAMDNANATGRFLCCGGSLTWNEFAAILRELHPTFPIPTAVTNENPSKMVLITKKSIEVLGITYRPVKETLRLQCEALIRMGLVKAANPPIKTVCVTGGSGFIALHIVKQLLESGRRVHATVRSVTNTQKVATLTELSAQFPGMLNLFEADLLGPSEKFDAALEGCDACLHTASPFFFAGVTAENAEEKLVGPALKGTLSVLEACARVSSIRKVVVTSSFAALMDVTNMNRKYSEADWNTGSSPDQGAVGAYCYSKTAAERAAWEFVETKKPQFQLATLCPPYVMGEILAKSVSADDLNTSSQVVLAYLNGQVDTVPDDSMGLIDVRDLASAHILAMENPSATGRFLVATDCITFNEFASILRELFPAYPIPTKVASETPGKSILDTTRSTQILGMKYRTPKETFQAQGESLIRLGLVKDPKA